MAARTRGVVVLLIVLRFQRSVVLVVELGVVLLRLGVTRGFMLPVVRVDRGLAVDHGGQVVIVVLGRLLGARVMSTRIMGERTGELRVPVVLARAIVAVARPVGGIILLGRRSLLPVLRLGLRLGIGLVLRIVGLRRIVRTLRHIVGLRRLARAAAPKLGE